MPERENTCCFTGHREYKLPWGSDENDPRCRKLQQQLFDAVDAVYAVGHAADEVAHPLGVGSLHRLGQTALQRQTAGVRLPAAPGQLVRAVPGEAAGGGAVHGHPSRQFFSIVI